MDIETATLYDDGSVREFEAQILEVTEIENGYGVVLDRTAFFPGGGGQLCDTGTIGGCLVREVKKKNGKILHITNEVPEAKIVVGKIAWETRLRRMQAHSGEHVVSGLAHRLFDCSNVGFHMSDHWVTIDFDKSLNQDQLSLLEEQANRMIYENHPVSINYFNGSDDPAIGEYRSKIEIKDRVRIVEFPGIDRCACCAPHVGRTGEIGSIHILKAINYKGGTRIELASGDDALRDYRILHENAVVISRLLSTKRLESAIAVERLIKELEKTKDIAASARRELAEIRGKAASPKEGVILEMESEFDADYGRAFLNYAKKRCAIGCYLAGEPENMRYIIASETVDLRQHVKKINEAIEGRGSGTPEMIQGICKADLQQVVKTIQGIVFATHPATSRRGE